MRELINVNDIPPLPAEVLGTDDLSIQMSLVMVTMGMFMHGASLVVDLILQTSRVHLLMQMFAVAFGTLLTTLGIIINQFALELVLALRVLGVIMLMSECFLCLAILMDKFKRLQRLAQLYWQSGQIVRNAHATTSFIQTNGHVQNSDNQSEEPTGSDNYKYRIVQPGAYAVHEITIPPNVSINAPPPSPQPSLNDQSQRERETVVTIEATVERAEHSSLDCQPPARQSPKPSSSNASTEMETTAAQRRAARKAFRLDPSVIRSPGEEPNEPVASTSDWSSDEPFFPPSKHQKAARPTTLNLPKTTFRFPSVGKAQLVPTISRAMQTDTGEEENSNSPFGEHVTSTIARRPPSAREPIYRNSEPIPCTSRQDPPVSYDKESNYVIMRRMPSDNAIPTTTPEQTDPAKKI